MANWQIPEKEAFFIFLCQQFFSLRAEFAKKSLQGNGQLGRLANSFRGLCHFANNSWLEAEFSKNFSHQS